MRRRRALLTAATASLLITLLIAAAGVRTARAQTLEPPGPRQGYYLSIGFHGGLSQHWEEDEALGPWASQGFSLRLGQMLTRRLGLGLQIWSNQSADGPEKGTAYGLGLEGQVALTGRLAVTGGLALGVLQWRDERVMNEELRGAYGAEYSLAASYDFFPYKKQLSGGLGLAPVVQVRFLPGDVGKSLAFMAGLHVSWWTGLPRNQLDLPPGEGYEKE